MDKCEQIKQELAGLADPKRADASRWFFKTGPGEYGEGDQFLGIRVPVQRRVAHKYQELDLPARAAMGYPASQLDAAPDVSGCVTDPDPGRGAGGRYGGHEPCAPEGSGPIRDARPGPNRRGERPARATNCANAIVPVGR